MINYVKMVNWQLLTMQIYKEIVPSVWQILAMQITF